MPNPFSKLELELVKYKENDENYKGRNASLSITEQLSLLLLGNICFSCSTDHVLCCFELYKIMASVKILKNNLSKISG